MCLYISKKTQETRRLTKHEFCMLEALLAQKSERKWERKYKQMAIQSTVTKHKLAIKQKILDHLAITPPLKYL